MKLVSRLVIALAICLIAIPMMTMSVEAHPGFSLSDDEGYVGDEVRISGSWDDSYGSYIYVYYELYNEAEDDWPYEKVRYYDTDEVNHLYYFRYDLEIPESCSGEHDILICYADDPDDDVDTLDFTVHPLIEIDENDGPAGTEVEVTGKGWDEDESEIEMRFYFKDPGTTHYDDDDYYVVVASEHIEVGDYGAWEDVTFKVPHASKGDHWIYAMGDENDDIKDDEIKGVEFAVLPGISLEPENGCPGDTITVTGSGFEEDEEDIKVTYDGEVVKETEADRNGIWEVSFEVPPSIKGKHKIDAYGEDTKAKDIEDQYFVVSPEVTLTPTSGNVGTSLSVSGTGFAASKSVTITYDGVQQTTATTDSKGSFSTISFKATHTQSVHTANHPVVITDASGNSVSVNFVMESNPPAKPTLSSPFNGTRIGFIGSQTPTFQWTAVTDPSGVSYKLQIASDPGFVSLVVPQISGLTEASYTLPQGQALPYSTYYWRVKAIDGAQNDSGWTGAYSFQSGLLPLWAFVIIIVIAVVLIAALLYLVTLRRR